jgi:hypothetical protein
MCKKLMFLISLVSVLVLVSGAFAEDRTWTNDSPYSQLACDPLNWDPNDDAPGPGDNAEVNPPPGDGPIFLHDQTINRLRGPVWNSDADQYMLILNGNINISDGWGIADGGNGTATVEIGTYPGWGEPNVVVNELTGFENGGVVNFIMAGNSRLETTDGIRIVRDNDHTANFDLSGNAEMIIGGQFRAADDGVLNLALTDNASLYVDGTMRTGDSDEGFMHLSVSGSATVTTEGRLGWGDDGGGTAMISEDAVINVGEEMYMSGRGSVGVTVTQSGGTVNVGDMEQGTDSADDPTTLLWTMNGPGVVNVDGDWTMGDGNRLTAILEMLDCDAAVTVDNSLRAPSDDRGRAEIYLHGGVLDVSAFTHNGDNWLLDICDCGVMIIDGDVVDEILDDHEAGNITVCGYPGACGAPGDLMVDYNNVNLGRTTIWVEIDPNRPYDPDPPCGEESVVKARRSTPTSV